VDVTADGKWILATCKTYLIVINTDIKDTKVTGFQKSMGQNKVAQIPFFKFKQDELTVCLLLLLPLSPFRRDFSLSLNTLLKWGAR